MKIYSHALITGASSGIGLCFAKILAKQKVNLVLVARRTDQLEKISKSLSEQYGISVKYLTVDLSASDSAKKIKDFCEAHSLQIDLLINNAGNGTYKDFSENQIEDHLKTISLNVTSLVHLTHIFIKHMQKHQKPSTIINVASVAAFAPVPKFAVYGASKRFVKEFSEITNHELAGTNINISCLCPGGTKTEFLESNNQVLVGNDKFLMSAEEVADIGLKKAAAGKAVVVTGLLNKLQIVFLNFLPKKLQMIIAQTAMGSMVQERT